MSTTSVSGCGEWSKDHSNRLPVIIHRLFNYIVEKLHGVEQMPSMNVHIMYRICRCLAHGLEIATVRLVTRTMIHEESLRRTEKRIKRHVIPSKKSDGSISALAAVASFG